MRTDDVFGCTDDPEELRRLGRKEAELRGKAILAAHNAEDMLEAKDARIAELEDALGRLGEMEKPGKYGETKSEQAYQVIAYLAGLANCFEHPEIIRALDYFSSDLFDPEFLPFTLEGKSDA